MVVEIAGSERKRNSLGGVVIRTASFPSLLLLAFHLVQGPLLAAPPTPIGSEFRVNTYTTGWQRIPSVAAAPNGDFVVVWDSQGSYGSDPGASVQGQRFLASGSRAGTQFQVNSYTTSFQILPAVAIGPNGEFVVSWASLGSGGSDGDGFSIQSQRYSADGSPLGGQFQVNTFTFFWQLLSAIAIGPDGEFVVVWDSFGSAGSDSQGYSIQAQRFAGDGTPLGGEFQVNSYTTSWQYYPDVAVDGTGEFVVVWESDGSFGTDGDEFSIQGQRFAADGTPLAGEFQVNTYITGSQRAPAVATGAGGFVVVWQSYGSYGSEQPTTSIQAQRFAAAGTRLGSQFEVSPAAGGPHRRPAVAISATGESVVVWEVGESPEVELLGQRFGRDGIRLGGEFRIATVAAGYKTFPVVVAEPAGEFLVVWETEYSEDESESEVKAQRFTVNEFPAELFTDDFETSDTSRWSITVP